MTRPAFLNPHAVAAMLFRRGIGLAQVGSEAALTCAVIDAAIAEGIKLGRCSTDSDAIRDALRALWSGVAAGGEAEQRAVASGRLQ